MIRKLFAVAVAVLVVAAQPAPAAQAGASHQKHRPVVFVHGGAGSAQQYQTQAKRLASNGYPADIIEVHDYDSTFVNNTMEQVWAGIDARVTRLLAQTNADKVDMLGHSLGTSVMHGYLNSSPERAARVAHYVNLDGRTATTPPGGVPTLAIWGEGSPERAIGGAANVYLSDQSHTQTVTSRESFTEVYRFFTGRAPHTTRILPQAPGHVKLSGRAVLFPTNLGVSNARLEIYEVNGFTGHRRHHRPDAVFPLSGDGSFGPFRAGGTARYEFAIVRDGAAVHHFYFEPFLRTDRLIRLLTSNPGEGLGALVEAGEGHSAIVVNRNKEWWGDQGDGSDVLRINGRSVLNAANTPRTKRTIGIFLFDRNVDQLTDLTEPIPDFFSQIFISGIDVYMPASPGGRGIVSVVTRQRGGGGHIDVVNLPNWPSTTHRSTVQINDYVT